MYRILTMPSVHGIYGHFRGRFFYGSEKKMSIKFLNSCRHEESSGITMSSLSHLYQLRKVAHCGQGVERL